MKILVFILFAVIAIPVFSQSQMRDEWQKMHTTKSEALNKFNDAKFGMFIHWGLYSVPAGIWKGKKINGLGEWIMYRAKIPRKEYKAICSQFNPTKFNADEWVKIAKDAGMKYIVCMPKHHDGFAMYHSKVSKYNIYDDTPFKRDPIEEIYQACKKYNMRFGFYYSHAVDWMDGGDAGVAERLMEIAEGKRDSSDYTVRGGSYLWPANDWDPAPVSFEEYLENKSLPQVEELMNKFPDVTEIWFDVDRYIKPEQSLRFYQTVYRHNPKTIVNSRIGNDFGDFWIPGDNTIPDSRDSKTKLYWETPGTLNNTWGYKSYDLDWKTVKEMIFWLTEIASKGGNYLLNVGPKSDGTFPRQSIDRLREIGKWMKVNGEAYYGTEKWEISKEGPTNIAMKGTQAREQMNTNFDFTDKDFWFTKKGNELFIISLSTPISGKAIIKSVNPQKINIKQVRLLGSNKALKWDNTKDRFVVELPGKIPTPYGYVLKVTLD